MISNGFKELFDSAKLKEVCKEIIQIDPDTPEFKTIRGKLMMVADGDIAEEILSKDPKREVFSNLFSKQIETIIGRALWDNKKAAAIIQEQLFLNTEISLKLLNDLETLLKINCGEKGEYSMKYMKLKEAGGMKNYLEKMSFMEIEEKILELTGNNEAKERNTINEVKKMLWENDWLENEDQEEKKFNVGLGLLYKKINNTLYLSIVIEHESMKNSGGGSLQSYGITHDKNTITNIIMEHGEYENDITEAFDLKDGK